MTEQDLDDIFKLRCTSPQLRDALPESASDATVIHAVLVAGIRTLHDSLDAASYEAEAQDTTWWTEQRTIARRRRPSWIDDA